MILPSGSNVTGDTYRRNCLRDGLLPFLKEKYPDGGYLFWPDLAAAHYARETIYFLENAGVPMVRREDNPPCVPQLRPVEDFWGILKQAVYKGGWVASSEAALKRRIRIALASLDAEVPRTMMRGVGARVRAASRSGVTFLLH